jgi:hypothetical protein
MDIRFVIIVFFVEIFAFGFHCWQFTRGNLDLYNNYSETPLIHNISDISYHCFTHMNHCHYHSDDLRDLNIFHLIFAAIGILAYFGFIILLCKRTTAKQITRSKVKLGNVARLTILVVTAVNSLILTIHYLVEARLIKKCSQPSQNVRLENMASYLIINVMEIGYLFFDFTIGHDESSNSHIARGASSIVVTDETPLLLNTQEY